MHNKNILLLQEEALRLLKIETELLQEIQSTPLLLEKNSANEEQTFDAVSSESASKILEGEQFKLERLEMVLAIVGTMKAGKSTTINAIVGTEVMPNRNRPMTALPTLITHTPGQIEPVLEFSNTAPIQQLLPALRRALQLSENREAVQKLTMDKDAKALLNQIATDTPLKELYHGAEAIFEFLKTLNDLVRLCQQFEIAFPFHAYTAVSDIPLIKVEFVHLRGTSEAQGRLTLLDTPGPNESGQQHLRTMLKQQLERASAILAVLDYSQLKSDADAQVRADLSEIADVAQGRMYALVNKFDQRDRNGDTAEEIKVFVSEHLLDKKISVDNIFPISANQAYLANRARGELFLTNQLPDHHEHAWVADFAEEALGKLWRRGISDVAQVTAASQALWEDSLFQAPMDHVIRFAQAKAAIMALDSTASKLVDTAKNLGNFFQIRESALSQSASALQAQINAVQRDIKRVDSSEAKAKVAADVAMKELIATTNAMFRATKSDIDKNIAEMFNERMMVERENEKKLEKNQTEGKGLKQLLKGRLKKARQEPIFDTSNPIMTFSDKTEAEEKLKEAYSTLSAIITTAESDMKLIMSGKLQAFETDFQKKIIGEAKLIVEDMAARMQEAGIALELSIPDTAILSLSTSGGQMLGDLIDATSELRTHSRRKDGMWGKVCGWFGTDDWGWESYTVSVDVYTIDSKRIRTAIDKDVSAVFVSLQTSLEDNISKPMHAGIDQFFHDLKKIVEHIRGDLLQGLHDIGRSKEEKEQLAKQLAVLKKNIPAIQQDARGLQQDVSQAGNAQAAVAA